MSTAAWYPGHGILDMAIKIPAAAGLKGKGTSRGTFRAAALPCLMAQWSGAVAHPPSLLDGHHQD